MLEWECVVVRQRVFYVLGGPLQADLEARKQSGDQPLSEFNLFAKRNDARIVSTDEVQGGDPISLRRRLGLARAITQRAADYDLLVTSGEDIGFPLTLASMLTRRPKPIWIILHGSYLQGRKFAAIAPLLRRARHVHFLCLAESLRAMMIQRHGFSADRCHNAGYGIDTSFFTPGPPGHEPLIVSAGSANRDYQTLVSAAEGLGVPVRIAADSLWRPKQSPLDPGALPDFVTIGSAGNYMDLRRLYQHASVVVVPMHPAQYACGYAVIAEAMAMGKVVIATRTAAPSDLLVHDETGYYVEPGDITGLRGKIRVLLDEPQRALDMGALAAERMRKHFSLAAYCETIERTIGVHSVAPQVDL